MKKKKDQVLRHNKIHKFYNYWGGRLWYSIVKVMSMTVLYESDIALITIYYFSNGNIYFVNSITHKTKEQI